MVSPLIGITTYRQAHEQDHQLISLAEAYVQAISHAGGTPILIPLGLPEGQLRSLPSHMDGILFSGGGDVAPDRYRAKSHPEVKHIDTDRDRVEIQLVLNAIDSRLPFLGICRGLQVINVALGGTLFTHIADQLTGAVHHPHRACHTRDYLAHEVIIESNSHLANISGQSRMMVNSLHHQGIATLAQGLQPVAHAPDGLVEGIELGDYPFGLAVQWHPEWLTEHAPMRAIFQSFVEAADL